MCKFFVTISALGFLLLSGTSAKAQSQLVINEIHFDPDVKTELVEFIELYNNGGTALNLTGWQLTDAVEFTFPAGTTVAPGGYVVVAQSPSAVSAKYGATALGPWSGKLSNEGERIQVRDASGSVHDEVEYKLGFPWPTVGDSPGYSIELVDPNLDNNLGGSWRVSVANGQPNSSRATLIAERATWRYQKGTAEASNPTSAWRQLGFNDSGWLQGGTPIGYGEGFLATTLSDMQNNYSSVFLRKNFTVTDPSEFSSLILEGQYDDGFKAWINGVLVIDGNANMSSGEVPFNATAGSALENLEFVQYPLNSPGAYLQAGNNVIAVQAHNSSLGNSSDFFIDVRLSGERGSATRGPTPRAKNSASTNNIAPQLRQVAHTPEQPRSGEPVVVSIKATDPDGVASMTLQYQVVNPGNYIELTNSVYETSWVSLPMNDTGAGGDVLAGDSVYSAQIPGTVQMHRRLVRYRIVATDTGGRSIRAPYLDDPTPNFAYFVYDGVPAWTGSMRGNGSPNITFTTNEMRRLPVYHLISKRSLVEEATWTSQYGGDIYRWQGTLIYDGQVYDHIRFRMRGGVWRYAMGKNMWKFDFNRGHDFQARDNYGNPYGQKWAKLNFSAIIQQGDYDHRGEQGMFESVGFRLFNLAGLEAPNTHWVQFRIIDDVAEANPNNQYEGDFWGLYLAIEQEDGRFLDEHDLPDGNLYKMEGGTGELNNQGPLAATDKSDLNTFLNTYRNTNPSDAWWRTNFNLPKYYNYQAIVQGIHHYDICYQKNYFYYLNPDTSLWSVHSWDLDLTWADNMFDAGCGGTDEFKDRVLNRPAFNLEYRNRVRELRDLLFNTDQAFQLIDEYAHIVRGTNFAASILEADRSMWDFNPVMVNGNIVNTGKAGQGRYYQFPQESSTNASLRGSFSATVQIMKNYIVRRSAVLDGLAADGQIPQRPTVTSLSPTNFPVTQLRFRASNFSGNGAFAAMKWRIAEVSVPGTPAYNPNGPHHYEIEADWESDEITTFTSDISIPSGIAKVDHTYRVRVKFKDSAGRWSNWSLPVQFTAGEPENAGGLIADLKVTELMYNSPAGSDYDFIELLNTSDSQTLDLNGVKFTQGIDFTFPAGSTLAPGAYLILAKAANKAAFRTHYGLAADVVIYGPYAGNFADSGEQVTLRTAASGTDIVSFTYTDVRGWPVAADGAGHSLVPLVAYYDKQGDGSLNYGRNWRASAVIKGSPGVADPTPNRPLRLNEIVSHTDYENPQRPEYDSNDWIELYNVSGNAVNLSGWYLSDDPDDLKKFAIPAGNLASGAWVSFDEVSGFHNPITTGFGLNKAGERVFLSYLPGTAEDRVVDAVDFQGLLNNAAWGRYPDGAENWYSLSPTRDAANPSASISVVITEVMYHPVADEGSPEEATREYIELSNMGNVPYLLANTNGAWRIEGDVDFTFATNQVIEQGESILLVAFNPTDTVALNAFRSAYSVADSVKVLGPYLGRLSNSGGRVTLEFPQAPDAVGDPISWVIVDEVIFHDDVPWSDLADGAGDSLQRTQVFMSGNAPESWVAGEPTPGSIHMDNPDRDGDGLPNAWEIANGLNPDLASDAQADADGDGQSNLAEYISGTDPQDAGSVFQVSEVTVAGSQVQIKFTALSQKSYLIQACDDLTDPDWITVETIPAASEERALEFQFPSSGAARFYRLVIADNP